MTLYFVAFPKLTRPAGNFTSFSADAGLEVDGWVSMLTGKAHHFGSGHWRSACGMIKLPAMAASGDYPRCKLCERHLEKELEK